MRVLITGSRNWTNRATVIAALEGFDDDTVIVHGGAWGADTMADEVAQEMGFRTEMHPAMWRTHGRAAGPIRNQEMVDAGADVCLAFPMSGSKGTWDCVRRARKAGIPVEFPGREVR
jgi:hypothetical protein